MKEALEGHFTTEGQMLYNGKDRTLSNLVRTLLLIINLFLCGNITDNKQPRLYAQIFFTYETMVKLEVKVLSTACTWPLGEGDRAGVGSKSEVGNLTRIFENSLRQSLKLMSINPYKWVFWARQTHYVKKVVNATGGKGHWCMDQFGGTGRKGPKNWIKVIRIWGDITGPTRVLDT